MSETTAHDVDRHIGARIRLRRKSLGLKLEQLATRLKLSYQQVQKYESAGSRIAASTLYEIGIILDVPVEWFFEGLNRPETEAAPELAIIDDFLMTTQGLRLAEAFCNLPAGSNRYKLVEFIEAVAAESGR